MITVSLAQIQALSNLVPFDMRPFGYDALGAAQFLDALGAEGRNYYLSRQIPIDMVYPALFAMTLVSLFRGLRQRVVGRNLCNAGIAFSVGAALCDYAENLGIAAMIKTWPTLSPALVHASSGATVAKSGLTVAAVSSVLLLGCVVLLRYLPKLRRS
jgi:hypothetical protein